MSIQSDIVNEFTNIVKLYIPSLSNRIQVRQNPEEQDVLGDDWLRLSFSPSETRPVAIALQERFISLQVDYYRKNGKYSEIEEPNEIKDIIMANIPAVNRPYWVKAQNIVNIDDPEYTDKIVSQDYEGFQLIYEINQSETITCSAPTLYVDHTGSLYTTESKNIKYKV